ncbi:hypothetical protein CIT37_13145 [Bradyrhizobium ottawaense]|uniref:Restriction endonuclease n=1 Tax=Bradyrhizobium ottawaense TaxID=931866 RepID=A0A2U8P6J7_9BRAD|nr:hypothetical protein [Bradyrhizobium ottawaense]AWL93044.1 hypothetical protein CIT37_13145 [Bradyrhizobium ottawaense]
MLKRLDPCRNIEPIVMNEWASCDPTSRPQLMGTTFRSNPEAQKTADVLRSCVDIREGYRGLEVSTTSFVGHVAVGPLRITINPKISGTPLATLLQYAYGLRDLRMLGDAVAPTAKLGFRDILIALLVAEIEELSRSGLLRRYIPVSEKLTSPRGRILVGSIASRGGIIDGSVPCRHFHRHSNWKLNQVLRSGLELAGSMTADRELYLRVRRGIDAFHEVEARPSLHQRDLDEVERGLTRLTATSKPALRLIRLLLEMHGTSFDVVAPAHLISGFLFDMNRFFQLLLSRFLGENLVDESIRDEYVAKDVFAYAAHGNPRGRPLPRPRPDFALFRAKKLVGFLDAKYRDIWQKGYPAEWLYQLSVYALASPNQQSIILYATTSPEARDERIDIRHHSLGSAGSVVMRPVELQTLACLVSSSESPLARKQRTAFARSLIAF